MCIICCAAYASRGWCRVEVLAALCPKRTLTGRWRGGPLNVRYRFHHDPQDPGVGPLVKEIGVFDPMVALFTSEGDREPVVELTKMIAKRYVEYVASRSTVWHETMDMRDLPAWLIGAGTEGAEIRLIKDPEDEQRQRDSEEKEKDIIGFGGQISI